MQFHFSFFAISSLKKTRRGFSLVELLVVISIMMVLASIVMAQLSVSRAKSRDSQRIADVGQIQLSLELFFDSNQTYPSTTPLRSNGIAYSGTDAGIRYLGDSTEWSASTRVNYISKTPIPPPSSAATRYIYYANINSQSTNYSSCTAFGQKCSGYALAIPLERSDNSVLNNDADINWSGVLRGDNGDCSSAPPSGAEKCYDINP